MSLTAIAFFDTGGTGKVGAGAVFHDILQGTAQQTFVHARVYTHSQIIRNLEQVCGFQDQVGKAAGQITAAVGSLSADLGIMGIVVKQTCQDPDSFFVSQNAGFDVSFVIRAQKFIQLV